MGFIAPLLVDTVTGEVVHNRATLVGDPSWHRTAGRGGTIGARLQLPAAEWTVDEVERLLTHRQTALVFEHVRDQDGRMRGNAIAEGVILAWRYEERTGILEVQGVSTPRHLATGRSLWTIPEAKANKRRSQAFRGSWSDIAVQVVRHTFDRPSVRASLPISYPPARAGTRRLGVRMFDLATLDSLLAELEGHGVIIDFMPTFPGNGVTWRMRADGTLDSPQPVFDLRIAGHPDAIGNAEWVGTSGSVDETGTGVWMRGEGTEWGTLIGLQSESKQWPGPVFDLFESQTDAGTQERVDSLAARLLRRRETPRPARRLRVWCDDETPISHFQPGQLVRVLDPAGSHVEAGGFAQWRVVSHRPDGGLRIIVTLERA